MQVDFGTQTTPSITTNDTMFYPLRPVVISDPIIEAGAVATVNLVHPDNNGNVSINAANIPYVN